MGAEDAKVGDLAAEVGSERRPIGEAGGRVLKTGAVYARVSTDKQERQETIASQLDALRRAGE